MIFILIIMLVLNTIFIYCSVKLGKNTDEQFKQQEYEKYKNRFLKEY